MRKLIFRYSQAVSMTILLTAVVIMLTWFIDNKYEDRFLSLETFGSIVSVVVSLLLFGVSWSIHQKYSANQLIIEKKAEKVLALLETLQSISLTVLHSEINTKKGKKIFNIRPTGTVSGSTVNEQLPANSKQYFHPNILDIYEKLVALSTDIFMPVHIANEIKDKFDITNMFSVDVENYDIKKHDTIVCVSKVPRSRISLYTDTIKNRQQTPEKVITRYNNNDVCADDLIGSLRKIYLQSLEWLKQNSTYTLDDLNIDNNTN